MDEFSKWLGIIFVRPKISGYLNHWIRMQEEEERRGAFRQDLLEALIWREEIYVDGDVVRSRKVRRVRQGTCE